jgi:hypothetical protein
VVGWVGEREIEKKERKGARLVCYKIEEQKSI